MGCWDKEAREEGQGDLRDWPRWNVAESIDFSCFSLLERKLFFMRSGSCRRGLTPTWDRRCMETLLGHVGGVSSLDLLNK